MTGWRMFGKIWWCHGGGAAVLALMTTAMIFRNIRDALFWAAIAFFVAHTAFAVWHYLHDRRAARATVDVTRTHTSQVKTYPIVFIPLSATSIPVNLQAKQTPK